MRRRRRKRRRRNKRRKKRRRKRRWRKKRRRRRRWRKNKRKRKRTKNSAEDEEDGEEEDVEKDRREVYGGGPKHTLGWTRSLRRRRSAGDDADADRIAFNHLIDNLDKAVEEEEDGKGESVEKLKNVLRKRQQRIVRNEEGLNIINVGPPSYMEIALGDHCGHELPLSLETWKNLYEQRWNIYKMLRNEYKDNFISVRPLTISVCMLNDSTLVYLDFSSVRMMIETTLRRIFEFDGCIDVTIERLARLVDIVDVIRDSPTLLSKTQYAIVTSLTNISSSIASYWL
ncbi:hypothetical protein G5I_14383 [Acromyrmex echinatior]|uniref:Uncharacterized protein n=1 Tax=Acromyrmex echinatior TaxID=103372 RepID=F4X7J1_ACREC|nr:hypothetical protein G5I_14383 [Acromyrmex echinatior]